MSGDTITIPLGYVISIASPILLSLVSAIVYLARRAEAAERVPSHLSRYLSSGTPY
jgi:hypothetical protein